MRIAHPRRPSPAMSVAIVALILSATGTGYAAIRLPAKSVGSRELKPNAVTRHDIKAEAVTRRALARNGIDGSKVASNALTGDDIDESTLVLRAAAVPPTGVTRLPGGPAAPAAAEDVVYISTTVSVPPGDAAVKAAATCPDRHRVIGGGVRLEDPVASIVTDAYPSDSTKWEAHILNAEPVQLSATAYAICIPVS